ncbi:hypothetical protein 40AC_76 [Mycobacterium phage 40AC]|uniref:Uncharacterized protein n=1 Tax=Mycobacterium phage 40AC TaxID=1458717 RepID=W8E923_9CAUD|nr:hypothetical protein ST40AC_76 [Mycobacterium phage 40AC]AHJ86439.1 hypothetical protein 40AC_76 [Mycobacterium phage 40AC]
MQLFVATIETRYQTMAVAKTAGEAIRLASIRAFEFLQQAGTEFTGPEQIIEYFGVTVTEVPLGGAVIVS